MLTRGEMWQRMRGSMVRCFPWPLEGTMLQSKCAPCDREEEAI